MQTLFCPTEEEIRHCEETGRAIYEICKRQGRKSADPIRQTPESNIRGYAGEFYAGRCYGVPVRGATGEPDPGYDLIIAGFGVSVKTTQARYEWLINGNYCWPLKDGVSALLLVRHDWPHWVEIDGWIMASRFIREHEIRTFSKAWGPSRCMHRDQLLPSEMLRYSLWAAAHALV